MSATVAGRQCVYHLVKERWAFADALSSQTSPSPSPLTRQPYASQPKTGWFLASLPAIRLLKRSAEFFDRKRCWQ
jgi:hypothetical protein